MSKFLVVAILLSLVYHGADLATAWDDKDFFRYCPPSRCSKHGPEIRFPLQLESSNTSSSCGASRIELVCSGQDTILVHSVLGRCKVTAIDYSNVVMDITPLAYSSSPYPLQELFSRSIPTDAYDGMNMFPQRPATLVCCPRQFTPSIDAADSIIGPVSCLSNATNFSYLVNAYEYISILPSDCKACSDGVVPIPINYSKRPSTFKSTAERILSFAEITLQWYVTGSMLTDQGISCPDCESQGGHCAFSSQRNQTFCMPHGIASNWPKVPYSFTYLVYFVIMFSILYCFAVSSF